MSTQYFNKQWRTYKPNKQQSGSALALQIKKITDENDKFNNETLFAFITATQQTGLDDNKNATFGWKDESKTVILKLGEPDIGELLAVLNGNKPIAGSDKGIYHQNQKGSTSLLFKKNGTYGYSIRIAKKIGSEVTAIQLSITIGEAEILRVLLESIIRTSYNWI